MTDNDREMSDYQPKHYTQQAPSPLCVRLQLMFVVAHVSVCVCEEVDVWLWVCPLAGLLNLLIYKCVRRHVEIKLQLKTISGSTENLSATIHSAECDFSV